MSKDDLKHALISLVLGVLITAGTSVITGALHILQVWLAGAAGGTGASISYLHYKNMV